MKDSKQYFDHHTDADKLYFCSDGVVFFSEQNAVNHSRQLEDPTITTMTREEMEQETAALTRDKWEDDDMEQLLDGLSEQ